MNQQLYLLAVLCSSLLPLSVWGNYFEATLAAQAALSETAFLAEFPYQQLLQQQPAPSLQEYENWERQLIAQDRPVGAFFLALVEQQVATVPLDVNDLPQLQQRFTLGEFLVAHDERAFQIGSDIIFENLAETLEQGYQQEILDKSNTDYRALVDALKNYEYGVSIPVSDIEKGMHHLKEGNWRYIWSRLWFDHPFLCVLGIAVGLLLLALIINKIKK
jgi:hypothetical protein